MPDRQSATVRFFKLLGSAVLVVLVFFWLMFQHQAPLHSAGLEVGLPMPPLEAAGWLKGPGPTAESLRGQVVVIEAWASWCEPCRAAAPELVELHRKYGTQGVVFVGLTSETDEVLPDLIGYLRDTKITWPNGFGAEETLTQFGAEAIPMAWVIGRDGKVAWNMNSRPSLEAK